MKHHIVKSWILFALLSFTLANKATAALTTEEKKAIAQVKAYNTAFKAIAREVTPSVVTINVKKEADEEDRPRRGQRNPFGFPFEIPPEQQQDVRSTGSGIVMTRDGYILTNHHVAGEADELTVTFSDNREYDAELVGSDPRTDIAVIKVDASGLKPASVGRSDAVQIGEWVLAIGAPLSLESTVTSGIVSAIGRDINIFQDRDGLSVEDFIQTDAAINPGNSGGALVNLNGEVIGVNTAIASSRGGSFIGYGFAVPIDLAKKVMDDIVKHGEVKRGYLGIRLRPVDAGTAEAFGLDRPKGVLIDDVLSGTPAANAKLRGGDIILKVDGREVNRPNHLQSLIARKHPGDTVTLSVRRKKQNLDIPATLGENLPEEFSSASPAPFKEEENAATSEMGLTVHDMTSRIAQEYNLDERTKGVVVTSVSQGPARDAGFSEGDVIFAVRQVPFQQDIETVNDFKNALPNLKKGRYAAFSITRSGSRSFLTVKIPD